MLSYQQLHEPTDKNRKRVREVFEMSERRRAQLIQEGTDPDKLKEMAVRFFEIMQEKGLSLKEADAASAILSNMVESAHHRNPNEKLKDIG